MYKCKNKKERQLSAGKTPASCLFSFFGKQLTHHIESIRTLFFCLLMFFCCLLKHRRKSVSGTLFHGVSFDGSLFFNPVNLTYGLQ